VRKNEDLEHCPGQRGSSTKLTVVAATGRRIRTAGSVVVVALAVVSGSLRHGGNGWEERWVQQLQKDRKMRRSRGAWRGLRAGLRLVCGVLRCCWPRVIAYNENRFPPKLSQVKVPRKSAAAPYCQYPHSGIQKTCCCTVCLFFYY
jgi:hypothetical protein